MTIRLGAHSKQDASRRGTTIPTAINALEHIVWPGSPNPSRRFGAQRIYYESWGDRTSFPDARMTDAIAKVPVMSITPPVDLYVNITAGNHDSQIVEWANALTSVTLPHGIGYCTFNHEADIKRDRYGSGGNTHQIVGPQYVGAFRRIIDIFRAHGVSAAGWRYGPILTQAGYEPSIANYWYLGDTYANSTDGFIGADGYNWWPCKPGSQPREFTVVIDRFWQFASPKATANGCHLVLGEIGCQEYDAFDAVANAYECSGHSAQPTTAKATWITNMRNACKTTHAALDVLCWFDSNASYNWWIDTRPGTVTAFANMGNDAFFGGGAGNDATVVAPIATATGSAMLPLLSVPGSIRVDAPTASANASAFTPTVTGTTTGGGGGTPTGVVTLRVGP